MLKMGVGRKKKIRKPKADSEKISQVDIPLARLTKIKNAKDSNYQDQKWERGNCYALNRHETNNKGAHKQLWKWTWQFRDNRPIPRDDAIHQNALKKEWITGTVLQILNKLNLQFKISSKDNIGSHGLTGEFY